MVTMSVQEKPMLLNGEVDNTKDQPESRLYKRRWIIIFVFSFYLSSNAFQWLSLNIIGDVILTFYNASLPEDELKRDMSLDWLSLIYMLTYVTLIFPSMWFLQKKGLRVSTLCGAFLNAIGAWIKVASVNSDRFGVLMFGQTMCAIAQVFTLSLPARIAAVWFGPNEVSTATAIGIFGIQIGNAVGFLLPPIVVPYTKDITYIGHNLSLMFYISAAVTTLCFILLIIVFRESPPLPPSKAQKKVLDLTKKQVHYGKSLLNFVKNRDFCLVCVSFAMNLGCSYAISTLLNPIILFYFKSHQKDAGFIGLTIILSGVFGSILSGLWLDRTKTFKGTTIGIYLISCIGMVVYTFILKLHRLWLVYVFAGFLGFFLTGYRPVGFQLAAEVTYPECEGTSSGLLNLAAEIIGIVSTIGMRALMTNVSIFAANATVCAALLVGTVLSAFIRPNYKRQAAGKEMHSKMKVEIDVEIDEKSKLNLDKT
ncbi:choline/ethanolamine transporter flvcr2b-like isoform X3 [Mytilus edulis]|uniref:choline/ethanolamine transporter flvcr2b-like isoform X3 n=1 Tax=Mytilus edulis TaxID=6550 RepID=UPI0039F033BF